MPLAYISHPSCLRHEMGEGHPECPQRLSAIQDRLLASGLDAVLRHYQAPAATRAQLERVHTPEHVARIHALAPTEGHVLVDGGDTLMNPHSLEAACHAAGALVLGVDLLLSGAVAAAFCAVRPPGHHAESDRAMGFCLFNNVAVGAAHALEAHGLERVAILDFDVHHGNGTAAIFRDDPRVLLCSVFQHPFYPHSNPESDREHLLLTPLPAGSDGSAFRQAIEDHWLPALEAFHPQLVLISAGFDGHIADPLAHWRLTETDYRWVTERLLAVARRHAQGRVLSTLEGGYALDALAASVVAHLNALLDG